MSEQVSHGSAGEYQADERAGVARLSWRVHKHVCGFVLRFSSSLISEALCSHFLRGDDAEESISRFRKCVVSLTSSNGFGNDVLNKVENFLPWYKILG